VSLVLVVACPPQPVVPAGPGRSATAPDLWEAVREAMPILRDIASGTLRPDRLDRLAEDLADDDPAIAAATSPAEVVGEVRRAIDGGARAVAVIPIAMAADRNPVGDARRGDLRAIHERLEHVGLERPDVEIRYLGPPFTDPPGLEAAIRALRPARSGEPALLTETVERAFGGDLERFGRFVTALQAGVPAGTRLVLRGSAVVGVSYVTGEPFDARGLGTSDLDVVLLGEAAMGQWEPGAFYLPGVNTQPLWDGSPDVAAPRLEAARLSAQEVAGRPVAIQAMAPWFLELRSGLQSTPYVILGG